MRRSAIVLTFMLCSAIAAPSMAHPLGNFSVNRWAALQAGDSGLRVSYVVDYAEIPTFQESAALDADADGNVSAQEIDLFADRRGRELGQALILRVDGSIRPLALVESALTFAPGAGGLQTMRLSAEYEASFAPPESGAGAAVTFTDDNFGERAGWREVIAFGEGTAAVVDSDVPADDLSHGLSEYPSDLLLFPPRIASASFRLLAGAGAARARSEGKAVVSTRIPGAPLGGRPVADGLTALMTSGSERFGLSLLLAAFAGALFWGGAHALSPGHGKTVVAAYLVGQRGTPWHAVWLGLIVTITHTIGVFALGALTLALSHWFVPETLYPWLGFASGLTVAIMGGVLLARRMRRRGAPHTHDDAHHHGAEPHAHADHDHGARHAHGPHGHTHELPERLSLKGLVALGVSGGIVPCPSALVVLLSAIAFHRILFGMALILAFSVGLASVLVAVGLVMVYARRLFERFDARGAMSARLGVVSAAMIAVLGVAISVKSLPPAILETMSSLRLSPLGAALGVLGMGLLFGIKHATEADHIAAVGAIVGGSHGLRRALWTGGLWGAGHTFAILLAGLLVLGLHLAIPEPLARSLEFGVALMIIALGGLALRRALSRRTDVHVHSHAHGSLGHAHLHYHEGDELHVAADLAGGPEHAAHRFGRIGVKPLMVGMMHGLAGSAALTLLVLAQIPSPILGFLYLLVFGVGSIGGMALMSLAISVPFAATATRPSLHRGLQISAGVLSLAFGVFYAWSQLPGGGGS